LIDVRGVAISSQQTVCLAFTVDQRIVDDLLGRRPELSQKGLAGHAQTAADPSVGFMHDLSFNPQTLLALKLHPEQLALNLSLFFQSRTGDAGQGRIVVIRRCQLPGVLGQKIVKPQSQFFEVDRCATQHRKPVAISLFEDHLVLAARPPSPKLFRDRAVTLLAPPVLDLFLEEPQCGRFLAGGPFAAPQLL